MKTLPLYTSGIRLYAFALRLAAPFHPKAKLWVQGRRDWRTRHGEMARRLPPGKRVWFHCASLGEFEQARPLIEALYARPNRPVILVSFFSPSGYEIRKTYAKADAIFYLPSDTPAHARALLDLWQPDLLVLVKYEIWLNLLGTMRARRIPAMLISARLREGSRIFSGLLAREYRAAYAGLAAIFTQDADTAVRLQALVPEARVIPGNDTRYDRVRETRAAWQPIPEIEAFVAGRPCLVCGSTWPAEEKWLLGKAVQTLVHEHNACIIIAPHETHASHVAAMMALGGEGAVKWSSFDTAQRAYSVRQETAWGASLSEEENTARGAYSVRQETARGASPEEEENTALGADSVRQETAEGTSPEEENTGRGAYSVRQETAEGTSPEEDNLPSILVIDTIGMLSRLYAYAQVAYVGGAFGSGLHNILEAAVFGVPVIFGPRHRDFPEAQKLIAAGGGFSIAAEAELTALLAAFLSDPAAARQAGSHSAALVESHAGATAAILRLIEEKGWLEEER